MADQGRKARRLKGIAPGLLKRHREIVFAGAATAGLVALASGGGTGLDRFLQEVRDGVRSHAASGAVAIVEIDARSLAAIDRWPWPRGVHAAVIDRLQAAGARSVAFDVDFSATSSAAEDAKLAASLKRAGGSVILPTFRQYAGSGSSSYVDAVPAKSFAENAFLAAVNVVPDGDGYVRRVPLGVETTGVSRPSLASMVAEKTAGIGRSFEVDYAIEPATIARHSVVDLIGGRVDPATIRGKRVIVGATAVEMGDRYAVPGHGVIPGVVIQALAAETLLAGPVPEYWGGTAPLLAVLLLIGLSLTARTRPRRVAALALVATATLVGPIAAQSLFAVTMAIAPALVALAVVAMLGAATVAAERYQARALTDAESGLPNLAALELAARGRNAANVVVARIDRFAAIASGLGPEMTAMLIQRVADRLRFGHAGRTVYRTEEGVLAWLELPGDEDSLNDRIDALAGVMRAPVECGRLVDVTLTFGLAVGSAKASRQLVADAGLAALHASQKGSRWERFSDADSDEVNWHLSLLGELDAAMTSGQLWNAYQPKLDIASGRITGAETLVRWLHPQRGPIAPDNFIPVVESAGRIRDLTIHVLARSLEDAEGWEREGHPLGVAVNVSATLLADHEFIEIVGQILRSSSLPTGRVTIEVTESATMASPDRAIAALESWRSLGVNISIDDYGTGQSSLGYLQKLPATELKIDKSFVQTVTSDQRNAIMVRSTIALAHELGIKVVAEGIEDAACLGALADMGCDTAQGYHIGKPMTAEALLDLLTERLCAAA